MFLAPNGTLFLAGPGPTSEYLNTDGTGSWTVGPTSEYGNRGYGPSVMYNNGQIMIVGGGIGPTATAEIINLNEPVPTWSYTGSMANPRRQANATRAPRWDGPGDGGNERINLRRSNESRISRRIVESEPPGPGRPWPASAFIAGTTRWLCFCPTARCSRRAVSVRQHKLQPEQRRNLFTALPVCGSAADHYFSSRDHQWGTDLLRGNARMPPISTRSLGSGWEL